MPHIPRRTPSAFGPSPEIFQTPQIGPTQAAPQASPRKGQMDLPVVNMQTWDVPADKLHKAIFGKEPKYNEHGQLVYPWSPGQPAGSG